LLAPFAAAYKPNGAFFESLGVGGLETLRRVIEAIPDDIPVLLDVKRGDIGSTAVAYATSAYDHMKADGVTLSPLMGWDSVSPFVTGMYAIPNRQILSRTSPALYYTSILSSHVKYYIHSDSVVIFRKVS
jgi:orotidine-5'-phosphate decarboxylase